MKKLTTRSRYVWLCAFLLLSTLHANAQKSKKNDNPKESHAGWERIILLINNDSVSVRMKPWYRGDKKKYSIDMYIDFDKITVAYDDNTEKQITANDVSGVIIPSKNKFVSHASLGVIKTNDFYEVRADGRCQYLVRGTSDEPNNTEINTYYVFFNDSIWKMDLELGQTPLPNKTNKQFKKLCAEIFYPCPALVAEIESEKWKILNLKNIVDEFNECIGDKPVTPEKK